MSDDIVTRLREYEAITDNAYVINALVAAADEIERWRHIAKELYTWLQPSPEDDSVYEAGVEAMTMYCKAVQGE